MKTPQKILRAWPLVGALLLVAATAGATGFRLPDQDAFATGRGEAFAATADNPSAIYYNPAGIAQLSGWQVRGGAYGLNLDVSHTDLAGANKTENSYRWHAVPQVFVTYGPEEMRKEGKVPMTFGLGVYMPYGLSSHWSQDSGFRMLGTKGKIEYYTINPAASFQLLPTLSVGGGLTINVLDVDLQQGLTPIPNNDLFQYRGDGTTVGYNLGLLFQPHPKISFGVNYRSSTSVDTDGTTTTQVYNAVPGFFPAPFSLQQNASAQIAFPQNAVFGLSYRPTEKWNLEFNADYTDWGELGLITVNQQLTTPAYLPLYWQASWYYEGGATYKLNEKWHVSAGYIYNQNSVPDTYYNPLVADMNRQFVSAGVGFRGEHFDFDFAYQYGWSVGRTVMGSWAGNLQNADGNYSFRSQAILITLAWRF